jgi:hypothetical protein
VALLSSSALWTSLPPSSLAWIFEWLRKGEPVENYYTIQIDWILYCISISLGKENGNADTADWVRDYKGIEPKT